MTITSDFDVCFAFSAEPARKLKKSEGGDGLTYEKEIARAGRFYKDTSAGLVEYKITDEWLDHWHDTFAEMSQDGLEVPVPLEHTANPEAKRASTLKMLRKPNSKGVSSLFAQMRFNDPKAASLAKNSGVSIYVPSRDVRNGVNGKVYKAPITHIALTNYPVINDLEPFRAVVLSLTNEDEDIDMTLRDVATQMGIDPKITDEQELLLAMSQKVGTMKAPGQPGQPMPGQAAPAAPMAPAAPARQGLPPAPPPRFSVDSTDAGSQHQPLSGMLLSMARENRENKLSGLVTARKITPAVAQELAKQYTSDDALAFSHLPDSNDGFETVIAALSKNSPVIPDGTKGGMQSAVALSKESSDSPNYLLQDADRRAGTSAK